MTVRDQTPTQGTQSGVRLDRWLLVHEDPHDVLVPMKRPSEHKDVEYVRPLVCVWDALHPNGSSEALFEVEVADAAFSQVWFFSMSNYLRSLDASELCTIQN